MRIKMLESAPGSPDGITVNEYEQGKTYEVADELGDVFVTYSLAERVGKDKSEKGEKDNKSLGAAEEENKGGLLARLRNEK